MKKLVIISGVSFLAILAIVYILLTRPITPTAEHWSYPKNITSPLSVKVADQAVTLGNLEKENVQIKLEGNTFDNPLDVTVSTPDSIPDIPKEKFTPLGSPIEITTAQRRFNKPMIITLRVPEASNKDLKAGDIQVIYYNGASWDIIKPLSVDATAKTVTFETYHASGWGSAKIDIEEEIKKYSHSKTIGKMAQKNVDKIVDKIVEQGLDYLMKDQMGMNEDSAKYKIISSLANDDDYAEILDSFNKGDAGEFNSKLMVFMGKKIAENVPKSALQKALKGLSSNKGVEYAGAAGEALGYLVEGDYKDAGRVIGEKIADRFLLTKLFKAAGEVVQYNIDTWKDAEIEAAYQAYKNGADHWFYGYNVDKGDFDGLYNQMRGIAVRLESEYVKREITRRENLGKRPATDDELNAIREQVRIDLEEQFKNRLTKESDLEKDAQHLQELVESMKKANLLEDGSFGFDTDHQTTEQRMDDLVKIAEKILQDTKRKDWTSGTFSDKNSISANDMISLVQAWFSTNGEELYAQELKDKFGIASGSGIEDGFTLRSVPGPMIEEDYLGNMRKDLYKGASIVVKDNAFDTSYSSRYNLGPGTGDTDSSIHLKGTYDPETETLNAQCEMTTELQYESIDIKQNSVYIGTGSVKITNEDVGKTVNLQCKVNITFVEFERHRMKNGTWSDWKEITRKTYPTTMNVTYQVEIGN